MKLYSTIKWVINLSALSENIGGTPVAQFNLISNLTDFMAEPLSFMNRVAAVAEKSSNISILRIGPKRFVFVFDPDVSHEVLVKKPAIYAQNRTVFDRIQPVTGKKGIVQLAGKDSQEARGKSRGLFTSSSLDSARAIVETYTQDLIGKLRFESSFDVTDEMTSLILKTAIRIFLGIDSTELVSMIGTKFLRLNYLCGLRMRSLIPPPLFVPTFKNREIKALQVEIRSLITKHVNNFPPTGVSKAFQNDEAMIDHCMTFLFAGHETTAASLAFTLLLLAQNPKYQDLIANGDDPITLAVYKESLRLYPPAYMLARQAESHDTLKGHEIRKGDQVIIGITELHRNKNYFSRPNDFAPERFLENLNHPFSFIPFGAGGKSCVGERLAYLEATIVIKMICQTFSLSISNESIKSEPLITLHPLSNQFIQLRPRKKETYANI